jgi:hypothetical protein
MQGLKPRKDPKGLTCQGLTDWSLKVRGVPEVRRKQKGFALVCSREMC